MVYPPGDSVNIKINLENYGKTETLMNNKNPNHEKEKYCIVLFTWEKSTKETDSFYITRQHYTLNSYLDKPKQFEISMGEKKSNHRKLLF